MPHQPSTEIDSDNDVDGIPYEGRGAHARVQHRQHFAKTFLKFMPHLQVASARARCARNCCHSWREWISTRLYSKATSRTPRPVPAGRCLIRIRCCRSPPQAWGRRVTGRKARRMCLISTRSPLKISSLTLAGTSRQSSSPRKPWSLAPAFGARLYAYGTQALEPVR